MKFACPFLSVYSRYLLEEKPCARTRIGSVKPLNGKDHERIPLPNNHLSIMKWLTSGAHRLKASLDRSFGARKNKKAVATRRSTSIFASAKVGAHERNTSIQRLSSQPIQRCPVNLFREWPEVAECCVPPGSCSVTTSPT